MATPRLRISADRVLRRRRIGGRPSRSLPRLAALALVPALAAGAAIGLTVVDRGPDSEIANVVAADTPITLYGHGYGHGRGMGQYGAYGYAKNFGWTAERIVGHYYGNTQLGPLGDPMVNVRLLGRDGRALDVYSDAGLRVAGQSFGPGTAARLTPKPGGADIVVTAGCGGRVLWQGFNGHAWVDPINLAPDRPGNEHLRLCDGRAPYRGAMGVALDGGSARTINRVAMNDYLYSVVPAESVPSWADSGGREALRAQAIAARSYAAAERRYGYAQTCDTQSCQVYRGSANEDWRTTEAVRTTTGTVIKRGGQVMAAEFSSSSGGFTAGGVFPAVIDEGDSVSPNRNWQQTVTAGAIAREYGVGELISFDVIGRNNLGADGGRVTRVKVVGTARTVEGSGDEARWKLGLKSDWFTVGAAPGPIPGLPLPPGSLDSLQLPPLPELSPESLESFPLPQLPQLPPLPPLPPGSAAPLPFAAAAGGVVADPIAAPAGDVVEESPIDVRYRELGGPAGVLGEPTSAESMLSDGSGRYRTYTGGTIVWTPTLGIQVVESRAVVQPVPDDVTAG